MKHAPATPAHQPLSNSVAAWIQQLETAGVETCVLTWPEFEALGKVRAVEAENRDIFRDLGVLGYAGSVTIFHADYWSGKPLKFMDFESRI